MDVGEMEAMLGQLPPYRKHEQTALLLRYDLLRRRLRKDILSSDEAIRECIRLGETALRRRKEILTSCRDRRHAKDILKRLPGLLTLLKQAYGKPLAGGDRRRLALALEDMGLTTERVLGMASLISEPVRARRVARRMEEYRRLVERISDTNLRLVMHWVMFRKWRFREDQLDDAFQEGWLGLRRAIITFDPRRSLNFSTNALFWIRNHVQKFEALLAKRDLPLRFGPEAAPAEEVEEPPLAARRRELARLLKQLPEREREIVKRYAGMVGGKSETYRQIAKRLGISRQHAHELHRAAIAHMRVKAGG